mgnify:CR=1 FL=1
MRKRYKAKHDTMLRELKIFGNQVQVTGEYAGLYLVAEFFCGLTEQELIQKAAQKKIQLYGLARHYIDKEKQKSEQKRAIILLGKFSSPALTKLTTSTVVALDDCTTAVNKIPTNIPTKRFLVHISRIVRSLAPATFSRPSLINFMPYKNNPNPATNAKTVPMLISPLNFSWRDHGNVF